MSSAAASTTSVEPRDICVKKTNCGLLRLQQRVFALELIVFGLQEFVFDLAFRRQLRYTRFRLLQLLPQHPRLLHALNRLRLQLHIQPKHLHLIPRSISSLAHATALHRAPRTRLLLQPLRPLALHLPVLQFYHRPHAFGHCCGYV
jgi:hypothetical protein